MPDPLAALEMTGDDWVEMALQLQREKHERELDERRVIDAAKDVAGYTRMGLEQGTTGFWGALTRLRVAVADLTGRPEHYLPPPE